MKRIKDIRHRIEQKTAERKHYRRRMRHLFRQDTKASIIRQIDPGSILNAPMPTTGKVGEFVKALKRK
jgi:hypothetical protein